MRNTKLILAFVAAVLVLVVAILVLAPTRATAQGLVEYQYPACTVLAVDSGVPPDGELVPVLEDTFQIVPWPSNYRAVGQCFPKFNKATAEFNKVQFCVIAYNDVDASGDLSPFDTKQGEV